MRRGLMFIAFVTASIWASSALAESSSRPSVDVADERVLELTLLSTAHGRALRSGVAGHVPAKSTSEEDAANLSRTIERVWSSFRAYRRPGGAEFIVRGSF